MAFLGLMTKNEYERGIAAIKEEMYKSLPQWLYETAGVQKYALPDTSLYENQADLYRKLSWVLQAVDLTASAAALSRFDVKRIMANKEPKDIPNHPFELLLMHPNPLDSRYEFLYGTVASFMLTGNSYWYLNRENQNAAPDELWTIPSHMITPVPDEKNYLKGYLYLPGNGREIFLETWQVVHYRRFNPFNRFVGLSAIEAIALPSYGDLGMQEWNTKFFKDNNARLPGILAFKDMVAEPTWTKIKDDTREASRKRELLMLRGVGDNVNWMQNAVSQKEMEFLKGREFNRNEIWNTLAPGLVSMLSESATEANSRTGAAVFNARTVYPKHVLMAEKITNEILIAYSGRPLKGEFEDIRIADQQLEMDKQRLYSETHTIAEIREEFYGDEPLGDERDELLPSQINATSGEIQEEEPIMPANEPQQEADSAENEQPEEPDEDEDEETYKAALDDLRKWERRALHSIGKPFAFTSEYLAEDVTRYIAKRLEGCTSQTAVKAVFDAARADVKPQPKEALLVLQGLMEALKAM